MELHKKNLTSGLSLRHELHIEEQDFWARIYQASQNDSKEHS